MEDNAMYKNTQNSILNLTGQAPSGVSLLEQEVLDEYERLSKNMKEVRLTPILQEQNHLDFVDVYKRQIADEHSSSHQH